MRDPVSRSAADPFDAELLRALLGDAVVILEPGDDGLPVVIEGVDFLVCLVHRKDRISCVLLYEVKPLLVGKDLFRRFLQDCDDIVRCVVVDDKGKQGVRDIQVLFGLGDRFRECRNIQIRVHARVGEDREGLDVAALEIAADR